MSFFSIILVLASHFIGDWYLQSREDAVNKSKDSKVLRSHILTVMACTFLAFVFIGNPFAALALTLIYGAIHYYQDALIYNMLLPPELPPGVTVTEYKPLWDVIALDQFLHLAVLFALASLL